MATFDEDEAEMLENLKYLDYIDRMVRRSRRIISPRRNDFEQLDDYDFLCRYRLPKESVRNVVERIGDNLVSTSSRNYAMSPMEQLLLALRFYATGTFQLVVGDLNDLSQSSACRAINRVSFLIAQMSADYIQLPKTESERTQISQDFFHLSGFPCVYGAIDCTHIPIQSPGGETAELFRNRKGYFSINVQTVSDSQLKIRNIVARWPGSSHDSTIFANSHLCAMFQAGDIPSKYHLLGDSGYGCKAYLLTPILNPQSDQEKKV
ncbi:putative nuclease HARBI1 [Centruroides vittatus]|uniref:putative nuclease HARBI1 n=3 Tax=Centruroides vittatus TaxID=120091 RepID=UPI00350FDBD6